MSITRMHTRKAENPYVMIDKTSLNDSHLSFLAKGIHAYLMSKPNDWRINLKHLENMSPKEGRKAIRGAMKELENEGYVTRRLVQSKDGRLHGWDFALYETPTLAQIGTQETMPIEKNNDSPSDPLVPDGLVPDGPVPDGKGSPTNKEAFTQNGSGLKKEKKKKNARAREPYGNGSHARENHNNHGPREEPPPTPEQQDEAVGAVKGLIDTFLERFGAPMPPAETDAATIATRKRDQLARARSCGLLSKE